MIEIATQEHIDKHGKFLRGESGGERLVLAAGGKFEDGLDLSGADLSVADLRGANLRGVDLRGVDLRGVDLSGANLRQADLRGADLSGADLSGANLSGANLRGADLSGANLSGAENTEQAEAITSIVCDGTLIVYKKAHAADRDVLLTLEIPSTARRSNATGRKCRFEFAILRGIDGIGWEYDGSPVHSHYDEKFVYPAIDEMITPDGWDEDRWNECSKGIHAFITRWEAEHYEF